MAAAHMQKDGRSNEVSISHFVNLVIPEGMKKSRISISIAFSIDILIRDENIISEKHKTKKTF